ncbi:MAG: hypothetical protein HY731_03880 [Candidatus Tectomicrobia bacterium]|nr:hypothetical protein [Candidatus Tectomicrobia bacterium]
MMKILVSVVVMALLVAPNAVTAFGACNGSHTSLTMAKSTPSDQVKATDQQVSKANLLLNLQSIKSQSQNQVASGDVKKDLKQAPDQIQ